ncbi:hypothetical protein Tco_1254739 [Tanacetum coccineum]
MIELEDNKEDCFARKRICIKTKLEDNILEKFKIIVRGKIFVIRAKELFVWSLTLNDNKEVDDYSEDDSVNGAEEINGHISKQMDLDEETDIEGVSDTVFDDKADSLGHEHTQNLSPNEKENSSDPFNLYNLLNKRGSILEVIDDMIKVDQSMGFTMEGCMNDMEKIIRSKELTVVSHSGLGSKGFKKSWIKELKQEIQGEFLSVQRNQVGLYFVLDVISVLLGNYKFEYILAKQLGIVVYFIVYGIQVFSVMGIMSITSKAFAMEYISSTYQTLGWSLYGYGRFSNKVRCMEDVWVELQWAIKGVMVDDEWVDNPCRVKEEFRLHFANRFPAPAANRCKLNYTFPNQLSFDQLDMLESPIFQDECA